MTDEQVAAVLPHAVRLAAAVAYGDKHAASEAVEDGFYAGDAEWYPLLFCLADLVTAPEGAVVRAEVRTHSQLGATLDALSAKGVLP
jgi:hypothetical protein